MWNESAVSASPGSRRLVSILLCLGNHGTGDPLLSPTITCGGNGSASDNGCVFPLHVTTSRDVTVSTEGHRGNPHPVQPITRRRAGSSRRIRRPFPCAEQRSLMRGIPSRDVTDPTFPPQPPIRAQHRWFPLLRPLVLHLYIEEWDPREHHRDPTKSQHRKGRRMEWKLERLSVPKVRREEQVMWVSVFYVPGVLLILLINNQYYDVISPIAKYYENFWKRL